MDFGVVVLGLYQKMSIYCIFYLRFLSIWLIIKECYQIIFDNDI